MFGRKKLKRIINNLQISRDGWVETVVALSKEAKELKAEIETLRKSRNEWVKIADDKNEEIKTLKDENASLKEKIKTLESEVERLTRKRDAKGRYVKMSRDIKVGDRVRLKAVEERKQSSVISMEDFMIPYNDEVGDVLKIDTDGTADVLFDGNGVSFWYDIDWLEHAD